MHRPPGARPRRASSPLHPVSPGHAIVVQEHEITRCRRACHTGVPGHDTPWPRLSKTKQGAAPGDRAPATVFDQKLARVIGGVVVVRRRSRTRVRRVLIQQAREQRLELRAPVEGRDDDGDVEQRPTWSSGGRDAGGAASVSDDVGDIGERSGTAHWRCGAGRRSSGTRGGRTREPEARRGVGARIHPSGST